MTSLDDGIGRLRNAAGQLMAAAGAVTNAAGALAAPITGPWDRLNRAIKALMPKGLYARSLLIIIVPMVVLQSVVAFLFMERHWNLVTTYLSSAVTQEIATLIDAYKTFPQDPDHAQLKRIAQDRLGLVVDFSPARNCRRQGRNHSSPSSTPRSPTRSESRSACRSGSIPLGDRISWKSGSS